MKRIATFCLIVLVLLCQLAGQETGGSRFQAIDIFVDSGTQPLAAYQLTFSGPNGAKIVGIEGGDPGAFAEPPYYDSEAMQKDEVAIAAFNTAPAGQLPTGRTRVATIHVQTNTKSTPTYKVKVTVAAAPHGQQIKVRGEVQERNAK